MSKTREYIKEKNIEVLFEELMRYVINKKPENPVKYLISLLQEKGETIITNKAKTKISSDGPTRSRTCASHDISCAGQAIDIRKSLERVLPKSFDSKPVLQEQDIIQSRSVSAPPPSSTIEVRVPNTESAPDIANESGDVKKREIIKERKEPTDEGDDGIVVSQEYVNNVESFFSFGRKKKKSEGSLASGSTATLKDDDSDDEKADDSKKNIKKKDDKRSDAEIENGEKSGKSKKKEKDKKKTKKEKDDEREEVTENEEGAEDGKKKDKTKNKEEKSDDKKIEKEAKESKKMDKKKKKDGENSDKENYKKKKHKKESEGEEKVDVDKAEPLEYSELTECNENSEKKDNVEGKMEEPDENGAAAEEGDEDTNPRQEVKECDRNSVMMTASCDLTELASWRDGEMEVESVLGCRDVRGSAIEQSSVRDVQSPAPPSTHVIKQILYCQSEDIILKEEVFFAVKSLPGVGGKVGPRVTSPCNTVFFDEPAEDLPVVQEPTQLVGVFKIPENRLPEQRERILKYRNSGNSDDMSISELSGSPWTYAESIS